MLRVLLFLPLMLLLLAGCESKPARIEAPNQLQMAVGESKVLRFRPLTAHGVHLPEVRCTVVLDKYDTSAAVYLLEAPSGVFTVNAEGEGDTMLRISCGDVIELVRVTVLDKRILDIWRGLLQPPEAPVTYTDNDSGCVYWAQTMTPVLFEGGQASCQQTRRYLHDDLLYGR